MPSEFSPTSQGAAAPETEEHAIQVSLLPQIGATGCSTARTGLEDRAAVEAAAAGEVEDVELVAGPVRLYAYGPDAGLLWIALRPVLLGCPLVVDRVQLRRGWSGSPCTDVELPSAASASRRVSACGGSG